MEIKKIYHKGILTHEYSVNESDAKEIIEKMGFSAMQRKRLIADFSSYIIISTSVCQNNNYLLFLFLQTHL